MLMVIRPTNDDDDWQAGAGQPREFLHVHHHYHDDHHDRRHGHRIHRHHHDQNHDQRPTNDDDDDDWQACAGQPREFLGQMLRCGHSDS